MSTDSQDPEQLPGALPATRAVPHHAAPLSTHYQSDPLPEQIRKPPATILPFTIRPKQFLSWFLGVLLLLAIAGGGAWYWWTSGAPPIHYKTALVDRGPITAIVTATGTVNPVVSVLVGSQVSGKIATLFADFNSTVTQGQTLAQIDPQPFKARVSQARAAVKSAKGNLAKAKNMTVQRALERDRMAALRPETFISQTDLYFWNTYRSRCTSGSERICASLVPSG